MSQQPANTLFLILSLSLFPVPLQKYLGILRSFCPLHSPLWNHFAIFLWEQKLTLSALNRYTQTHWLHPLIHCLCWFHVAKSPDISCWLKDHSVSGDMDITPPNQLYCTVPTDWVHTKLRQQAEDEFICQQKAKYFHQLHGMLTALWSLLKQDVCLVTKSFQRPCAWQHIWPCVCVSICVHLFVAPVALGPALSLTHPILPWYSSHILFCFFDSQQFAFVILPSHAYLDVAWHCNTRKSTVYNLSQDRLAGAFPSPGLHLRPAAALNYINSLSHTHTHCLWLTSSMWNALILSCTEAETVSLCQMLRKNRDR